MLNSKYAPLVAVTVVVALMILGLGYLFGVKPQIDSRGDYIARKSVVEENTASILDDSAAIDEAKAKLDKAPKLTDSISAVAPSELGLQDFLMFVSESVKSTGVEVAAVTVSGVVPIEPWNLPANTLPSDELALHFQSLPTPRLGGEAGFGTVYTPVVPAPGAAATDPAADPNAAQSSSSLDLESLSLAFKVKGRPEEVVAFIKTLTSGTRLFQVTQISTEAKQAKDAPEAGLANFKNGDVEMTVSGSIFLLNPDLAYDETNDPTAGGVPTGTSPFQEPATAPQQAGAAN